LDFAGLDSVPHVDAENREIDVPQVKANSAAKGAVPMVAVQTARGRGNVSERIHGRQKVAERSVGVADLKRAARNELTIERAKPQRHGVVEDRPAHVDLPDLDERRDVFGVRLRERVPAKLAERVASQRPSATLEFGIEGQVETGADGGADQQVVLQKETPAVNETQHPLYALAIGAEHAARPLNPGAE